MTEDLQALIDRLQREAVEEGQQRARSIVGEGEARVAALLREAEEKAASLLERAERDSKAYTERSSFALEQAGRDLLISVSQSVERLVTALVHESLTKELRPELLSEMLVKMTEAYSARDAGGRRMAVLLGPDDIDEMVALFAQRYRDKLADGIELKLDNSVVKGFRVSTNEGHVEHDFTVDAIAEALTHHLRPRLAALLSRVAPEAPQDQD